MFLHGLFILKRDIPLNAKFTKADVNLNAADSLIKILFNYTHTFSSGLTEKLSSKSKELNDNVQTFTSYNYVAASCRQHTK